MYDLLLPVSSAAELLSKSIIRGSITQIPPRRKERRPPAPSSTAVGIDYEENIRQANEVIAESYLIVHLLSILISVFIAR